MTRLAPLTGIAVSVDLVVTFWGNTQVTDVAFWGLAMSALFLGMTNKT